MRISIRASLLLILNGSFRNAIDEFSWVSAFFVPIITLVTFSYLMDEIQTWWEVPSIAHFCSLFRAAFNLLDFDIEVTVEGALVTLHVLHVVDGAFGSEAELEEALLVDSSDCGVILVQQLVIQLLKGCLQQNDITEHNFEGYLNELLSEKHVEERKKADFLKIASFKHLSLRTKVEIIHSLCDYRLDASDVADVLKNLDSDSLRVEPLGKDDNGATYWYFYGTRLYKEDARNKTALLQRRKRGKGEKKKENIKKKHKKEKKKKKKCKKQKQLKNKSITSSDSESDNEDKGKPSSTGWNVVCSTEEDWKKLAKKFEKSRSHAERELYDTIKNVFLPEIGQIAIEKERNMRKRLAEMAPRRVSDRIKKIKSKDEEILSRPSQMATQSAMEKVKEQEAQDRANERMQANEERARRAQLRIERTFGNGNRSCHRSSNSVGHSNHLNLKHKLNSSVEQEAVKMKRQA